MNVTGCDWLSRLFLPFFSNLFDLSIILLFLYLLQFLLYDLFISRFSSFLDYLFGLIISWLFIIL